MGRVLGVVAFVLVLAMAGPAVAQDEALVVPIGTVVRAPQGSITELATVAVEPELQGRTCVGEAVAENQDSVHPDNNLIVTTGDAEIVIPDVEGTADEIELVSGPFTLGETVTVSLQMGPDEVFSGGFLGFVIDCQIPPPTTTTTTTSTTEPPPPTTVPPTTAASSTIPPTTLPPSTSPQTVTTPPPTMPATGPGDSDRSLFGGLALITAGAALLVGVQLSRRRGAQSTSR